MFVRAVVQEGIAEQAILVPQQGVSRNSKGESIALVVDEAGAVQQRMLTLNRAIGNKWLVSSGISGGDRLVVEGMLNVRPGVVVHDVSRDSPKTGGESPKADAIHSPQTSASPNNSKTDTADSDRNDRPDQRK
jgi:membrane fusion protein (multidrug efflux system)